MSNTRHDWKLAEVAALFEMPFMDLLYRAQTIHRQNFDPNTVQISKLLSIKTGACPEDCGYCAQSGHYKTNVEKQRLMPLPEVLEAAKTAKAGGATRFCMGAAWRSPTKKDLPAVIEMVKAVKDLGLETCVTLGMLDDAQAQELKEGGLDYYNHNLDTSPEYYPTVTSTRTYQDRLDTLKRVREAGIKVCCGGIIGMGESRADRIGLLVQLANLSQHPESVPINRLGKVKGTPFESVEEIDSIEFIRTIAVARIMMPLSVVRLSAGRDTMSEEMQALCFFAGASSIFNGKVLLTIPNPELDDDWKLLNKLGIKPLETVAAL